MKNKSFLPLLGFEWRKNFLSPWMLVFLALLLVANGWKLQWEYRKEIGQFAPYQELYNQFYDRWKGPITTEKVQELMTIYGPLEEKFDSLSLSSIPGSGTYTDTEDMDHHFFHYNFAEEMEYDYLYHNEALEITEKSRNLTSLYDTIGAAYPAAESRAFTRIFQGRSIPDFADTRYIEVLLNHDYSAMLVLLLCLFGLCTMFVTERESEMYMLQRTTKLGGRATVAAKFLSSVQYVVLVCLLFFGEDFLVLQLLSGHWEALSSPLYAIQLFEAGPLGMTIGQFILWSGCMKTLGVLGCGCLVLLLSCLMRRVLTAFVTGLGGILALVVLQELCRTRVGLKWFNPMELVMVREISMDTTFVNVLGLPVQLYVFVLAGVLLTMAALVLLILHFHPGRRERR